MAVTKIIELVGSSTQSSDDAVQQALGEARKTLRNIKAVDVVSTGLRGEDLGEWRAHVRVSFLVEGVGGMAHRSNSCGGPCMVSGSPGQEDRSWQPRSDPERSA